MKVAIYTNVLLVSISPKSKFRPIFDAFINSNYDLCVTTDILVEYEEIFTRHMGGDFAEYTLQLIEKCPKHPLDYEALQMASYQSRYRRQ